MSAQILNCCHEGVIIYPSELRVRVECVCDSTANGYLSDFTSAHPPTCPNCKRALRITVIRGEVVQPAA